MNATPRRLLVASGLPRNEARILLSHVLAVGRTWLLAHDDEVIADEVALRFHHLAQRRLAGEPIAYLVGEREFMGHRLRVSPAVLIPRPETELLVETGLTHLAGLRAPRVLDLGTGSGAIAIALALARPDAEVAATDSSASALVIARRNAAELGARVQFWQGDWWDAAPDGAKGTGWDLIVSNPPYIAPRDPHLAQGDLRFEPPGALTDYADGLSALRAIIAGAPPRLNPAGAVWLEHGYDQAEPVRELLRQAGFPAPASRRDLAGIERISGAVSAGAAAAGSPDSL